ncbi:MAG: organoarsenical effux MFS transporter ArsJ [Rhodospirillaceae bacterium]
MTGLRNYALVTSAYWGFTLTDGALRMLVLLHFHTLGYSPFDVAMLLLFYEFFGVITNLVGGWIGARFGLKPTLFAGLAVQVAALVMLAQLKPEWVQWLSVLYVMITQAFSGIAKDLTKMSAKSAIKLVVPDGAKGTLYKWVAILTGSKNALKGVGFFLGGALLQGVGFTGSLHLMAAGLAVILVISAVSLPADMGRARAKTKFTQIFSKSPAVNRLSAARFFLFGSRDVWFVVGLPVFLYEGLHWSFTQVGGFLALWIIGYGVIQSAAPAITRVAGHPDGRMAAWLAFGLAAVPGVIAYGLGTTADPVWLVVAGLILFALVFALNSAVHSYLILDYSDADGVALNVGFYYMANAGGRLLGTVLSGAVYQVWGLQGCLWAAVALVVAAAALSLLLPIGPVKTGTTKAAE